ITILVRKRVGIKAESRDTAIIFYCRLNEKQSGSAKLIALAEKRNVLGVEWLELQPDAKYNWFTEGLHSEFVTFLPMGSRELKIFQAENVPAITRIYGVGVKTNRDSWAYDFDYRKLLKRIEQFTEDYNAEVSR